MALTEGQRIGSYQVVGSLGAGGMGEVYRATDTKLGRAVAIKVLPSSLAQDPERLARFDREARTLAALNHPNIAAIHGVEEAIVDSPAEAGHHVRALVMELVEGPTLAERIAQGPMPLDEALPIARQIADALAAAHEQGIIHRDLKPANIKVRPDGTVKVLDFGLAKAMEPAVAAGAIGMSRSPTITTPAMTQAGLILGTAAYMSPEQARGKVVDKRSDIWSFGCVVFEMLTGSRAFDAEDVSLTLSVVLQKEPDFAALPATVPSHVTQALRVCLRKDPRQRAGDIQDVRLALDGAFAAPIAATAAHAATPAAYRRTLWAAVAAALLVATVSAYGWWKATRPVDHPLMRLSVDLGPDAVRAPRSTITLSPDGTRIAFIGQGLAPQGTRQLFTRRLDEPAAVPVPGTQYGSSLSAPFFSPKGDWIGYVTAGSVWKVPVEGGSVIEVGKAPPTILGASWGDDDWIVFSSSSQRGLFRVPASGGTVEVVKGETVKFPPQVLPGGRAVLTSVANLANFNNLDDLRIEVVVVATGETKTLLNGYGPHYLPTSGSTGHLVFVRQGTLFGVPFDPERLEVRGTPTPLVNGVGGNDLLEGGGQFTFSTTGTLAYLSGAAASSVYPISWMNASGQMTPIITQPSNYGVPRLSPDGSRLAYIAMGPKGAEVWVYDLERNTPAQLTFTAPGRWEVAWAPDSKHLVFGDGKNLWWTRSDGSGVAQRIFENAENPRPFSFSPDGRLVFGRIGTQGLPDIWTLPIDLSDPERPKPGKAEPFLTSPEVEVDAAFSPDGKFLAYASTDSGTNELFVRAFPGPGSMRKISMNGGKFPAWSRTQLFFLGGDDRIMVVDYTTNGAAFVYGTPRPWAPTQVYRDGIRQSFDVDPTGKRVVVFPRPTETKAQGSLHATFLLNFFDEVRRRIP